MVTLLSDEWWQKATAADQWKPRYECVQHVFSVLGCDMQSLSPSSAAVVHVYGPGDEAKAKLFLGLMTQWLQRKHTFTKLAILRLLSKTIDRFPVDALQKCEGHLSEAMIHLWDEQRPEFHSFVAPTLLKLWKITNIDLDAHYSFRDAFQEGLSRWGNNRRALGILDFVAKATMTDLPQQKIWQLFSYGRHTTSWNAGTLGRVASLKPPMSSAACKALYALQRMDIPEEEYLKRMARDVRVLYQQVMEDNNRRKTLLAAKHEYDQELASMSGGQKRRSGVMWIEL